jgi:hypothetical protein
MTTGTLEDVDLETIFDLAVMCENFDCRRHPDQARQAVQFMRIEFPCCIERKPICKECSAKLDAWRRKHHPVGCDEHNTGQCAHFATFEPL